MGETGIDQRIQAKRVPFWKRMRHPLHGLLTAGGLEEERHGMNRRIGCWTRMLCAVLCLGVLLGMAPCAAAEEAVHGEEKPFGVPVELTGVKLGGRQVIFGVGEKGNGGEFYLMKASGRSCIASEFFYLHVCVGLFWKLSERDREDYYQFSKEEKAEILKQLSDVKKLTLSPRDGRQVTAPTPEMRPDGMPEERVYRLYGEHAGEWLLTASCKVDGVEYEAYSLATRTVIYAGPAGWMYDGGTD